MELVNASGWRPYSYHDYPRTVSTVLFLTGCNLRCPYCQNPDIVLGTNGKVQPDEFFRFLDKRGDYVKGAVITGGEPTMHANLVSLVRGLKARGLKVKLDTNALFPEAIERVFPWLDYLAFDVKTSPWNYGKLRCPYKDVRKRLRQTAMLGLLFGKNAEARMTMVRGFVDEHICHEVGTICRGVHRFYFQKLNRTAPMLDERAVDVTPFSDEEVENFRMILSGYVDKCEVR